MTMEKREDVTFRHLGGGTSFVLVDGVSDGYIRRLGKRWAWEPNLPGFAMLFDTEDAAKACARGEV